MEMGDEKLQVQHLTLDSETVTKKSSYFRIAQTNTALMGLVQVH